jgi:parallel beta-helix repeat protein
VLNNYLYGASHRGVILSPVSHNNTIQNNLIENFGSTGIHLAWGSGENIITGNTLRTSVSIIEGNGIKCYYGCANNNIVGNCVSGTLYAAYRLAVGCYDNQIINNKAFNCGMGIVIETLIHKNSGYYNSSYYQPSHAPPVERSVVKGNYLFKCKDGIVLAQRGNSYLRNNEIIDNQFWQCQHNFKYSEEKKGKLYGVKFENNINKVLDTKGC